MNPEMLKLSNGAGDVESPCLMTKAALVHAHRYGYLDTVGALEVFTDSPCWVDPIVRPLVVFVNDFLPEGSAEFDRLDGLLPRILAATKISDPVVERRVHARVLCSEARKVLHLVRGEGRAVCEAAIAAREGWLVGEATEQECQTAAGAAWAAGVAETSWAAYAAGAAGAVRAARATWAVRAAWAAWAAGAAGWVEQNGVDWLTEFLDTLEKAKAEEGVMIDDGWIDAVKEQFAVDINGLSEETQQ